MDGVTTAVGAANATAVSLRGEPLDALVGRATFTEVALLAITGRRPSPGEVRVADAVLVTFVDHGFQPSALAARMTYHVAPEALQGAVAAGLLGVGSRILGTMEQTARLLADIGAAVEAGTAEEAAVEQAIAAERDAGRRIPGIGHALHRSGDPRTAPMLAVAAEEGVARDEVRRLGAVVAAASRATGRDLPANAAGAAGALLLGIGIPWQLQRGIAMISRTAGLLAHIGEEIERPVTPAVRDALRKASWLDEDGAA